MARNVLEELFKRQNERIDRIIEKQNAKNETSNTTGFAYGFPNSTLAEAQSVALSNYECRIITDARKSGEGAGLGTGLPAFYDPNSGNWLDFSGSAITT